MGFFDRLYYGKAGKRDYTEMDMPKNRIALFFLVLKDRFFDIVKANLLQVVFWIPFMLWTMANFVVVQTMDISGLENNSAALLREMSGYLAIWLMGLIPCVLITGPSSAGSAYIMRNWARDQHAFLFSDYKDAFKGNWKQALGVSLITCLMPIVVFTSVVYYGQLAEGNMLMFLPMVVVLSFAMMWTLMLPLLYALMIGYELTFKVLIKNAFLMAAASLPKMVLARLITFIPVALLVVALLIGNGIMLLIMIFYYLLFGFAFSKLVYASFANGVFDQYLNPRIEGAEVNMGLRPREIDELFDDDDEDEEENEEDSESDDE